MLKIHQRLALITLAPMAVDLVTDPMAKTKGKNGQPITHPTWTNLNLHAAPGRTTATLYFTTANFSVFAPKVPGVQKRGAIRVHEALALIHGLGMIFTPILKIRDFRRPPFVIVSGALAGRFPGVCFAGSAALASAWPKPAIAPPEK